MTCSRCNTDKHHDDFPKKEIQQRLLGLKGRCKECRAKYRHGYLVLNRDKINKRRRADSPMKKRHNNLKSMYGLSLKEWDAMFFGQGNACKICKTTKHAGKGWQTDHDHLTGKIRGILCQHCNSILGYAKDSVVVLNLAIKYLHETKN